MSTAPTEIDARTARGAGEPIVQLHLQADGLAVGATAIERVRATPERAWAVLTDVAGYAGRIPLIEQVRLSGTRVRIDLRLRIALLSVGFHFEAEVTIDEGRSVELRWVSGEPKAIRLRFDLLPDGDELFVRAACHFDVLSLGWLVKLILRHHPEVRAGVFSGTALVLTDAFRRAAES
jgi:hypothetical protein